MRRLTHILALPVIVVGVAFITAAPAAANAPTIETSTVTFGPFVDDETCAFEIDVIVQRTRKIVTYANGDVTRHTDLIVTSSANGKSYVEHDRFNVFTDADAPTLWVITGLWDRAELHGRTLWLQSGRLQYDLEADQVTDPHPGPLAEPPDICDLLGP